MDSGNLTTIGKTYLLRERRDGFDEIQRGSLTIKMADRTGNEYTNFSNRCEVIHAPKKGKYKEGDLVWVHHLVRDQSAYDDLIYASEEQIWFAADNIEDLTDGDIVVFKHNLHNEDKTDSGLVLISYDDANKEKYGLRGEVVSGYLPKGTDIYYKKNMEYEVWQNELMYLIVDKKHICMADGVVTENWYEIEKVDETSLYISKKIRMPKRGIIALLKNPSLPLHGQFCVLRRDVSPRFVSPSEILATIEIPHIEHLLN